MIWYPKQIRHSETVAVILLALIIGKRRNKQIIDEKGRVGDRTQDPEL